VSRGLVRLVGSAASLSEDHLGRRLVDQLRAQRAAEEGETPGERSQSRSLRRREPGRDEPAQDDDSRDRERGQERSRKRGRSGETRLSSKRESGQDRGRDGSRDGDQDRLRDGERERAPDRDGDRHRDRDRALDRDHSDQRGDGRDSKQSAGRRLDKDLDRDGSGHKRHKQSSKSHSSSRRRGECWLRAGIRVRVASRSVSDGKYYGVKAVVQDVLDPVERTCILSMAEPYLGAIVDGVSQSQVDTALPKPGGRVMVVRGPEAGLVGKLLERDGRKDRATVELAQDLRVARFRYDDVAEYCFDDFDGAQHGL